MVTSWMDPCVQLLQHGVISLHRGAPSALQEALQWSVGPCFQILFENFSNICRVNALASQIPKQSKEELWALLSLVGKWPPSFLECLIALQPGGPVAGGGVGQGRPSLGVGRGSQGSIIQTLTSGAVGASHPPGPWLVLRDSL